MKLCKIVLQLGCSDKNYPAIKVLTILYKFNTITCMFKLINIHSTLKNVDYDSLILTLKL